MSQPNLTADPITVDGLLRFDPSQIAVAVQSPRVPLLVVRHRPSGAIGVQPASLGDAGAAAQREANEVDVVGALPPEYPEWLGDRSFNEVHGTRFPYVTGAMANGIASTPLVIASARAGFLAFFGAAGLDPDRVERECRTIASELAPHGLPWGSNLIHNPAEPDQEAAVADLYIRLGVTRVSAAAYMGLTQPLVRYACAGLSQAADGTIQRLNHVFAKISHPTVARHFLQPAPESLLGPLVERGELTAEEARIARLVPVAEDITVESDSGGHTDNRPLGSLFPTIAALRDEIAVEFGYARPIRVGAAGGLGTPASVASAFALGAGYVLTGSVNQACVESGLSERGCAMLAEADLSDVVMAPAADMFEMGVEVQVLQRGTLFASRARKLLHLYRGYASLEEIPATLARPIETQVLKATFAESWAATRSYWLARDRREVDRAERDPKHQMALVFRSYLGQSSRWAIAGDEDRRADFQIWCGPAMGAFNAWAKASFLEDPRQRGVAQVGLNLLEGAAVLSRAHQLRRAGAPVPAAAFQFRPRPLY
jgi:trans-AT polyketide synthase/acyltransferase/oxidoreductase domain-containing protein